MAEKMKNSHFIDADELKFRFDGTEVNIDTMIENLKNFKDIAVEALREEDPDKEVSVTIKGVDKGSVIVDYGLAVYDTIRQSNVFTADNIKYAANIVKIIGGAFKVAGWLKGKKPKEVKEVTDGNGHQYLAVENNNGTINNFDLRGAKLYLGNKEVQSLIAGTFNALSEDKHIKGFEVLDRRNRPLAKISRDDFKEVSESEISIEDLPKERITKEETILPIALLTFESGKKWEFYFNGNRIKADIKDGTFSEIIDKGERFAKGDSLQAELEIRQNWDPVIGVWINKSYRILTIHKHLLRPKDGRQGNLFDEPSDKAKQ